MRALHRLSTFQVKNLPAGKHSDGGGLWLYKKDASRGSWFVRIVIHGRRREMGLGSIQEVSLREARDAVRNDDPLRGTNMLYSPSRWHKLEFCLGDRSPLLAKPPIPPPVFDNF